MRLGRLAFLLATATLITCLLTIANPSLGEAEQAADSLPGLTEAWLLARGGRLYDDWVAELEASRRKGNHAAYPAAGSMKGRITWLCRGCHGWDYRGKDGIYATGPHYTGIKGVDGVRGMRPERIAAIIRNDTHRFTVEDLPDTAIKALALFLSRGQVDMARYIDQRTGAVQGDPAKGGPIFQTTCGVCHGLTGQEIQFREDTRTAYLGHYCREDPWKVLHKIRSGQPGISMVTLTSFDVQIQLNVLAHCRTLPVN